MEWIHKSTEYVYIFSLIYKIEAGSKSNLKVEDLSMFRIS